MKVIDIEKWPRCNQYKNFIEYTNPIFSVGTTLDVTKLVKYCEENNVSFFPAFLYVVTRSVNAVDEMKIRIFQGNVVMFDKVHPGYVILCENDELKTCKTFADDSFQIFYNNTLSDIEKTKKQHKASYNEGINNDCYYVSCLPWVRISSISNAYNLADKEQTSIPRVTWGQYYKTGDRYEIGFDIAAHHALVDGLHVSKVIHEMESMLDTLSFLEE